MKPYTQQKGTIHYIWGHINSLQKFIVQYATKEISTYFLKINIIWNSFSDHNGTI